jgi:two-component sensor histidine kinase
VPDSLTLRVLCRPASLREVRRSVDTLDNLPPRTFDAVKLATNELVSNSIAHAGLGEDDHIEITIETQADRVRIDVRDNGDGFTMPTVVERPGGRGLPMVQALSSVMGICHNGVTHAWAEVALA